VAVEAEGIEGAVEVQGRGGESPPPAAPRPRKRKTSSDPSSEPTSKRGLYLTPGTWFRLQQEAIRKGRSVSSIAEDLLAKNLPRFRVEREG
jgi:hypothetical protein